MNQHGSKVNHFIREKMRGLLLKWNRCDSQPEKLTRPRKTAGHFHTRYILIEVNGEDTVNTSIG
jgi:hypothetical protein